MELRMRYLVAMFVPGITFFAYLEVQPYGVTYDETRLLVSFWVSGLAVRTAGFFITGRMMWAARVGGY
jgi:hypothetical protein